VETAPVLTTTAVTTYTGTTATMGGDVTASGGETVTARGVVYSSTDATPTIGEAGVVQDTNGSGTGTFSESITGLAPNTTYYVRAYATNSINTAYGSVTSFTTNTITSTITAGTAFTEENLDANTLAVTITGTTFADSTLSAANFTLNNAPSGVTISSISYTDSTHCTVTLAYTGTDFDVNVTTFSLLIAGTELTSGLDLTSGNLTITATVETAPELTTTAVTTYTATTATMGGNVTASGGESVTARGVVYSSTDATPTIGEPGVTQAANGSGTGTFSESITGLTPNTTCYVRSYATNSVDTTYGSVSSFTTDPITSTIAAGTALTEENLDANTLAVTISGTTFADSTLNAANFTLNNAPTGVTIDSITYTDSTHCTVTLAYTGADFDANVSTFHLTIAGTELSSGLVLVSNNLTISATVETAPAVTTTAVTTYTATTATMGGEVTASGGESVTDRGVVYSSTDMTPTIGEPGVVQADNGTATGTFSESITGLTPNTTYYVASYATNSVNTTYGLVESFTTDPITSTIVAGTALTEENLDTNTLAVTIAGTTFADSTLSAA